MRTYYRCIVENEITEVGVVYDAGKYGRSIIIELGNGSHCCANSTFLNDHFEVATYKDYINQMHDRINKNQFTFDYVEPYENKGYKTEKKPPKYLDWAELVLEAYCN